MSIEVGFQARVDVGFRDSNWSRVVRLGSVLDFGTGSSWVDFETGG